MKMFSQPVRLLFCAVTTKQKKEYLRGPAKSRERTTLGSLCPHPLVEREESLGDKGTSPRQPRDASNAPLCEHKVEWG